MKHPLLLLLACNAIAFAAERPGGFLGIPWGASPEEAKRTLQKRPGIVFPENADDYRIELTGGTFAGQPATKWVIEFPERKFASATVMMKAESHAASIYKDFKTQLTTKYGPITSAGKASGGSTKKSQQNNGYPQAQGNMALWRFQPSLKEKSSVVVSAELTGVNMKAGEDGAGTVTIKYVNETLAGITSGGAAKPAVPTVKKDDL